MLQPLKQSDMTICIEGHTACEPKHAAGRKCNLQPLSTARVEAVRDLLRKRGVPCNLVVHGWGCHHPEVKVAPSVSPKPIL